MNEFTRSMQEEKFRKLCEVQKPSIDIACGANKQVGFVGLDKRELPGVDIVWDLEVFPWPLSANSCRLAISSHFMEHLKPWLTNDFMDEVWRVLEPGADFAIAIPYGGSRGFWQDPTHCNGLNEVTWQYFDPRYTLYQIYRPKPWEIRKNFPVWQSQGNLEVIMKKIPEAQGEEREALVKNTLQISVAETVSVAEKVG